VQEAKPTLCVVILIISTGIIIVSNKIWLVHVLFMWSWYSLNNSCGGWYSLNMMTGRGCFFERKLTNTEKENTAF
jgi:hypothetical protein